MKNRHEFDVTDLKPGMYVKLKNGREGILLHNDNRLSVYSISDDGPATIRVTSKLIFYTNDPGVYRDSFYGEIDKAYSIVKVYSEHMTDSHEIFSSMGRELLWEYIEEPVELTVAEIEERLGYKIKIVER